MIILFRQFDEEDRRVSALPAPKDFDESLKRLRGLIDKLPQRQAILQEHIDRWLDRTVRMAIDRMEVEKGKGKGTLADVHNHVLWHVRRASAIGGSEAGTVTKHFRGKRGGFSDARSLVQEKLLIRSPMPGTKEMSRGVRGEPWLQEIYRATGGGMTIEEDLAKLRGARSGILIGMIGTPDDIVTLKVTDEAGNEKIRRRMLDYKCPSVDVVEDYEKNGMSFDYICQVHHYGMLALAAGVKFDDMSIEAFDYRSFEVLSFPIPFDKTLAKEIVLANEKIWMEFVMPGILPEKLMPPELELDEPEIVNLGFRLAGLNILGKDIEERAGAIKKQIAALAGDWHGLSEGSMKMEVASYDRVREWDQAKLLDIGRAAGFDVETYGTPDKAIDAAKITEFLTHLKDNKDDPAALADAVSDWLEPGALNKKKYDLKRLAVDLEEIGINVMDAAGISERFNLTRKKSGPEVERLNHLKNEISGLGDGVEAALEASVETIRAIAAGERDPHEDLEIE